MALKRIILEMGSGNDLHGGDYTKAALRAVQDRRRRGQHITDLSWLRLRPWRRALAEAFERVPWTPGTKASGSVRHGRMATAAAILLAAATTFRVTKRDGRSGDS